MTDKRDIKRHKKRISIRFGIDATNRIAFTEDISLTGMFIKTPNIVPPNSKIKISFELPGGATVELEARVMWAKKVPQNMFHLVKKSGMGVRFLRYDAGEALLRQYFEQAEAQG
jgi:c-di-GMP-binding flagellar brake protein YcgR